LSVVVGAPSDIFVNSSILNFAQARILADFYSKERRFKWKRIYHGKTDGMTASA
jgi:hypothetical protein